MKNGFTLIELIVVITILAILGTIGFVSLQGYTLQSRESARVSDLKNISTGLEVFQAKTGKYPTPLQAIIFTGGVSDGTIVSQGLVDGRAIQYSQETPQDPLTQKGYTYSILEQGNKYQLGAEMEQPFGWPGITSIYATMQAYFLQGNYISDSAFPSLIIKKESIGNEGIFGTGTCFYVHGQANCTTRRSYANSFTEEGLVGYWDMEVTGSGMLVDSSKNGNHGSFSGGMTETSSLTGGVVGMARYFSGGLIDIAHSASLESFTKSASVVALVKPDTFIPTVQYIINKYDGAFGQPGYEGRGFHLLTTPKGFVAAGRYGNSLTGGMAGYKGTERDITSGSGVFYHIVGIFNNGTITVYKNGRKVSENIYPGGEGLSHSGVRLGFGGKPEAGNYRFSGVLDEIKIYNRALSPTEVIQMARTSGF